MTPLVGERRRACSLSSNETVCGCVDEAEDCLGVSRRCNDPASIVDFAGRLTVISKYSVVGLLTLRSSFVTCAIAVFVLEMLAVYKAEQSPPLPSESHARPKI